MSADSEVDKSLGKEAVPSITEAQVNAYYQNVLASPSPFPPTYFTAEKGSV